MAGEHPAHKTRSINVWDRLIMYKILGLLPSRVASSLLKYYLFNQNVPKAHTFTLTNGRLYLQSREADMVTSLR